MGDWSCACAVLVIMWAILLSYQMENGFINDGPRMQRLGTSAALHWREEMTSDKGVAIDLSDTLTSTWSFGLPVESSSGSYWCSAVVQQTPVSDSICLSVFFPNKKNNKEIWETRLFNRTCGWEACSLEKVGRPSVLGCDASEWKWALFLTGQCSMQISQIWSLCFNLLNHRGVTGVSGDSFRSTPIVV